MNEEIQRLIDSGAIYKSDTYDNTFVIKSGTTVGNYTNTGNDIYVTVPFDFDWSTYSSSSNAGYFSYAVGTGVVGESTPQETRDVGIKKYSVSNQHTYGICQEQGGGIYGTETNYTTSEAVMVVNEVVNGNISNVAFYGGSEAARQQAMAAVNLLQDQNFINEGGNISSVTLSSNSTFYITQPCIDSYKEALDVLADNGTTLFFITGSKVLESESEMAAYYVSKGGTAIGINYEADHWGGYTGSGKCDSTVAYNWGDVATNSGELNYTGSDRFYGYYTYDEEGNRIYHEGFDGFTDLVSESLASQNIFSFKSMYMESNYSKTIDMINAINSGTKGINIDECIPQVNSQINTGSLVNGVNDTVIDYAISNASFVSGITSGLDSIASAITAIRGMDESLATLTNFETILDHQIFEITVSSKSYSDYTYTGTYIDYIDTSTSTCCDICSSDVSAIRNQFESMITSDNSYLNQMIAGIDSLKSGSGNSGEYWNTISGVLDGYNEAINNKIKFNSDTLTEINKTLDEIQSAIDECGHDPVTQTGRNIVYEQLKGAKLTLKYLNQKLYVWNSESKSWQQNPAIAQQIVEITAQIEEFTEDLAKYDVALEIIKNAENKLNKIFYEFQKYNAYSSSVIPNFPSLSLNDTGKAYIDEFRNNKKAIAEYADEETGTSEKTLSAEGITDTQKSILAAAMSLIGDTAITLHGSSMEVSGHCAAVVMNIYKNAGISINGNADDLYAAYCNTSVYDANGNVDVSKLQEGMLVATDGTNGSSSMHVGVYAGLNENGEPSIICGYNGSVQEITFDQWKSYCDQGGKNTKCGFPDGVDAGTSLTPSISPEPSISPTPSVSSTPTPSVSSTPTPSVSSTPTPSVSSTPTPSVSSTPTPSVSSTPTPSVSSTSTPSATSSPNASSNSEKITEQEFNSSTAMQKEYRTYTNYKNGIKVNDTTANKTTTVNTTPDESAKPSTSSTPDESVKPSTKPSSTPSSDSSSIPTKSITSSVSPSPEPSVSPTTEPSVSPTTEPEPNIVSDQTPEPSVSPTPKTSVSQKPSGSRTSISKSSTEMKTDIIEEKDNIEIEETEPIIEIIEPEPVIENVEQNDTNGVTPIEIKSEQTNESSSDSSKLGKGLAVTAGIGLAVGAASLAANAVIKNKKNNEDSYYEDEESETAEEYSLDISNIDDNIKNE